MNNINLFQANSLPFQDNEFRKEKQLDSVRFGLYDYLDYIENSIKVVHNSGVVKIPLRKIKEKNKNNIDKVKQDKTATKYFIDTDKFSDKLANKIENELFDREVKGVFLEQTTGNWKEDKQNEIKIIDRNEEERYIVLDSNEDIENIYLKANDYQLRKQKEATLTLRNKPLKEHTALQKLFDLPQKAQYYFKENLEILNHEPDWAILNEPEKYDGTYEQQDFVQKALQTLDFALLEGPSGSGKTTAIIELIIQLVRQGKRVLLVSATHVAVDNVFHRILTTYKKQCEGLVVPLRISDSPGSIRKESVSPYRLQTFITSTKQAIRKNITKDLNSKSKKMLFESLKDKTIEVNGNIKEVENKEFDEIILKSANLVGGTMIGILQHPEIKKGGIQEMFDVMIVDESSKVTFLDFLVPALFAKKWILVGDVNQLSPYTEDDFINENIDQVIEEKMIKEKLIKSFEMNKRLQSNDKWDKESLKILFSFMHSKKDFPGNNVFEIKKGFSPTPENILRLNGADIVICMPTKENLKIISDYVYVKSMLFEGKINHVHFRNRQKAFHKNKNRQSKIDTYAFEFDSDKNQEWAEMVGSRLSQMYQYRFEPELNKQIKQEFDLLVPQEYQNEVEKIRRIALPSILELLQIGVGEKYRTTKSGKTYSEQKLIYSGFNQFDYIKEQKFQSLSYQHRMNDEIASIPREYFYKGKNLITANTVFKRKNILDFYKPNESDVIWMPNKDNTFRKRFKGGRHKNINPTETEQVKEELNAFIKLAKNHQIIDENGNLKNYEVAILTFYREQERELRKILRQLTGQKNKNKFFKKGNVEMILCTVDKFQGDEADMVLLSFTKFTKKAFYNSPNRLNVALTRARYKLVLFGNPVWLAKNAMLDALRSLAEKKDNRLTIK